MNKPLYYYTSLFAWGVVFLLIVFYAFAWNPPTDNPPNANLPAPINTSSVEQTKAGNLNLGGLLRLGLLTSHPTGTNGAIYYNTTDNKFYGYQGGAWKELGSGGGASFWLASGDNIYNTNTGNVGIGTTEPSYKLDVQGGQINASGGLCIAGTCKTNWPQSGIQGGGILNYLAKFTGSDTIGNSQVFDAGTNVGIGTTTPSEKLEVSGNIKLSGASPTYKITNVAEPTASSDVATKGYVDASSQTLYITTRRSSKCDETRPDAWCPTGWTVVTSWTYDSHSYISLGPVYPCVDRWRETLCSK